MYLSLSLIPVLCAVVFSAYTWRNLKSPVLFVTVAVLLGLGVHQAVIYASSMVIAFNNQFWVASSRNEFGNFIYAGVEVAVLLLVLWPLSRRL